MAAGCRARAFLFASGGCSGARLCISTVFSKDAVVQPSLVIVYFGGNDSSMPHPYVLSPHVPLSEYKDNMRQIGLFIRGLSEMTRVIYLSCPPVSEKMLVESARTYEAYILTCLNRICNELCRTDPSFQFIDLFSAIQKRWDWADTCFTDGIHFSEAASEIVVVEILKMIGKANWKPSLYFGDLRTEFEDVTYPIRPLT